MKMKMKMKTITLTDMVAWAKDRLQSDLQDFCGDYPFANAIPVGRRTISRNVLRMARLMNLPISYASLAKLRKAGYWNGSRDTLWETCKPPANYEGQ